MPRTGWRCCQLASYIPQHAPPRPQPHTRACLAICWTSVVLPVPVSPTSSTGSDSDTAAATRSMLRSAWPVGAKREALGPLAAAASTCRPAAASCSGSAARPTARSTAPACTAGLCSATYCCTASGGTAHNAANARSSWSPACGSQQGRTWGGMSSGVASLGPSGLVSYSAGQAWLCGDLPVPPLPAPYLSAAQQGTEAVGRLHKRRLPHRHRHRLH